MKALFDRVSFDCSKMITKAYSTSFTAGILCLDKKFRKPIYGIYGFVRLADEIVDSFHNYDKKHLLADFKLQTHEAIHQGISLNPVLNGFQLTVKQYDITHDLIDHFLASMETDLQKSNHNEVSFNNYIFGSAEVVGLMCLKVFTEGDVNAYERLKHAAQKLGSAFQKVNFLRDISADFSVLGRIYFPRLDLNDFNAVCKAKIEADILADFEEALEGIRELPKAARGGVYLAYIYYKSLFEKIRATSGARLMQERIRIPNKKS